MARSIISSTIEYEIQKTLRRFIGFKSSPRVLLQIEQELQTLLRNYSPTHSVKVTADLSGSFTAHIDAPSDSRIWKVDIQHLYKRYLTTTTVRHGREMLLYYSAEEYRIDNEENGHLWPANRTLHIY